jgi:gluconolactonase
MDDCIEILEDAFYQVLRDDSRLERLADGFGFTEGPTWWAAMGCLVFSDIPGDTIYRWTPADGVAPWRRPSRHANGNTIDPKGNLLTCEHGSRTVTRTSPQGQVTTVAAAFQGRKLNSPNDIVVQRDGTIWFTDPPYGIQPDQCEQPANYVFRLDPWASEPVAVASDFSRPNGLCFSPDERLLYIADSDTTIHHVRRFTVSADHSLGGGEVFAVIAPGVPDGMRTDAAGRLFVTAGDGVHVFAPDGRMLGRIRTPQTAANCAFGGPDGDTLFITATSSVWRLRLATRSAGWP